MTAAGEMPPKIVMVMPYAVGMMPFAVWPFRERPKCHCVCKVKLASSINTQFRVKPNSGGFPILLPSLFGALSIYRYSLLMVISGVSSELSHTFALNTCTEKILILIILETLDIGLA